VKNRPGLVELHDRVATRPNIKAYLASDRRIPFNESGIFRTTRSWMVSVAVQKSANEPAAK
jgi:hypothetical protein